MRKILLIVWLLLVGGAAAVAQPQAYNWRFGVQASISFPAGGAPVVGPATQEVANEGCASISDDQGILQCYSNGLQVWDRTNVAMPNGVLTGSNSSATQGALLLRAPGQLTRYYLFTVDAQENSLRGGLRYSTIDMTLRAGLGDVELPKSVPVVVPGGSLLTEKLTAVRHANGRDYWIVVHGHLNNQFYCYLLSSTGLSATPVVSSTGNTFVSDSDIGYMHASPNGQLLATAELTVGMELFAFDNATGQVVLTRAFPQVTPNYSYGLEFSPDNTKLYISNGTNLYQIDLSANYRITSLPGTGLQAVQRAPDGRLYVAQYQNAGLAVVQNPNVAGTGCGLVLNNLLLSPSRNQIGLPNFPNDFTPYLVVRVPTSACAGSSIAVSATSTLTNTTFAWDFGDPTSSTNTATGANATHTYAQAGTFTSTLTATPPAGGLASTVQQTIVVAPLPTVSLGTRQRTLCAGQTLVLSPAAQSAGASYRWQDGTTTPAYTVRASGHYVLTVTSAAGCTARDSVDVTVAPLPVVRLAVPAVLCSEEQPVVLRPSAQLPGTTYRWQDGTTTELYVARRPGQYRLTVTSAAGCTASDSVNVRGPQTDGECVPVKIPNVITPNGDAQNDFFVLQGLVIENWSIAVYNRWGREVFKQATYDNRWDATGQSAGVYYYLVQNAATGQQYKGWVEVIK